jgi:predicted DsbA family dithiol-disulfide isomerase
VSSSLERLQASHEVEVVWRSYELRPKGSPPLPEAYRQRIEAGRPQFAAMARKRYGLKIHSGPFGIDSRLSLIGDKYAEAQGVGPAYHDAVFRAYWQEARDIGEREVLLDVARSAGLDPEDFSAGLDTPEYLHAVLADITQAQYMGLSGVPALIFASKYLVSGAQPYEVLCEVVEDVQTRMNGD